MKGSGPLRGGCLCGAVGFEVQGETLGVYQCHCSACRRITGSNANASCIVARDDLAWTRGESHVRSYVHGSGYRSDFCATCGSPAPNIMRNGTHYWVPAGALQDTERLCLRVHLCVASKAAWETGPMSGRCHDGVPSLDELIALLTTEA